MARKKNGAIKGNRKYKKNSKKSKIQTTTNKFNMGTDKKFNIKFLFLNIMWKFIMTFLIFVTRYK
jgi:hypothetical protein